VSLTQAPLSAAAATVTGLAAFAAVASDAGWQFVRHGTVMAHEGAHAALGSLAFRKVSGVTLNADATGATEMRGGGCRGGIFIGFAGTRDRACSAWARRVSSSSGTAWPCCGSRCSSSACWLPGSGGATA
jgi:hypothetical protein